jgi:flagellar L-ring protein precursor FlgH
MNADTNLKAARRTAARKRLLAGTGMLLTGFGTALSQGPPMPQGPPPMMVPPHAVPVPHVGPPPDFFAPPPVMRVRDYSWAFVGIPEPREILVHDILTIIVNEKAEVNAQSRYNRQRNGNLKAELKEFMRIDDEGNLATAAPNQPTIDTNLQGRLQSSGQASDQESIKYRIAATVVDVLPNGNIVLEARKSIRSNKDVWEYSLTGTLRPQDINPDNTALSENIANLDIVKKSRGKVHDSTQRPWGIRLYDTLAPF